MALDSAVWPRCRVVPELLILVRRHLSRCARVTAWTGLVSSDCHGAVVDGGDGAQGDAGAGPAGPLPADARAAGSCSREVIAGFWPARVRCPSTVRAVRNRFRAVSRSAATPRAARAAG